MGDLAGKPLFKRTISSNLRLSIDGKGKKSLSDSLTDKYLVNGWK
ncbi:MAG: hypothetical protein ABSD92_01895 [Candidatus Bathyarchaeia archaeon]